MAIYISNAIYLATIAAGGVKNRPLIGWHSVYFPSSVTTSHGVVTGYPGSNLWSPDTYTRYRSTTALVVPDTISVYFNIPSQGVNYGGIAGHNFGAAGISYKWMMDDGGSLVDLTDFRTPQTDQPIVDYFDDVITDQIVLRMSVPPSFFAEIAHAKVGNILQLERPRFVGDIPGGMDTRVEKIGSRSYSGQHLGSVLISQGDSFKIEQENNTPAFVRSEALQNFFRHAHLLEKISEGPAETFFYAWRPDDYPAELQYCGETTSFSPPKNQRSTSGGGLMNWSMSGDAFK